MANPFLPETARKMLHMMKVVEKMLDWENAGKTRLLSVGYSLRAPELLFRKVEDAEVEAQVTKLRANSLHTPATSVPVVESQPAETQAAPLKEEIVYDDFAKLDLRVGVVRSAVKVPKADKLLQLEVDLGFETRTILSGIAMHFSPEEVVGRQVVVVANLAPRKMRGVESKGMILMAEDTDGRLHFVAPQDAIAPGSGVT
jgi:methionyl-tRNA synthetase